MLRRQLIFLWSGFSLIGAIGFLVSLYVCVTHFVFREPIANSHGKENLSDHDIMFMIISIGGGSLLFLTIGLTGIFRRKN